MSTTATHVFEAAGLGLAPFRYVGCYEDRGPHRFEQHGVTIEVGAPGQPMGTCAYCGQGIAICCSIESADGRRFTVGSECVAKTGDAGLRKVQTDAAALRKTSQREREETRISAALLLLEAPSVATAVLCSQPSTIAYRAAQGDTRWDQLHWLMLNAGHAGKLRATRAVERAAKSES